MVGVCGVGVGVVAGGAGDGVVAQFARGAGESGGEFKDGIGSPSKRPSKRKLHIYRYVEALSVTRLARHQAQQIVQSY